MELAGLVFQFFFCSSGFISRLDGIHVDFGDVFEKNIGFLWCPCIRAGVGVHLYLKKKKNVVRQAFELLDVPSCLCSSPRTKKSFISFGRPLD